MSNILLIDQFKMRGESMTRIEAFVAASFAFAVTMMVISVGSIPASMDEFVTAAKQIPSFIASCALIIWIWHTHAVWSRRYGLEDAGTITLSSSLIVLVLIYIYPLRLMMQGLFQSISFGYLPLKLEFHAFWEVRFMFAFYAIGFLLMSANFIGLYWHALRKKEALCLSVFEIFDTKSAIYLWSASAAICVLSLVLDMTLPDNLVGLAGYIFFITHPVLILTGRARRKRRTQLLQQIQTKSLNSERADEVQN
ncbi:MAG: TMEM175 family protein [Paraglaciecola sp.]|uniref:TMEM175 family protein n=1 Tax=Flavobacterium sp. W21_SRS_FM6 TaxID=3240268 RepID=UPI002767EF51|nr:TMEM175 family protein [Paraglaciecola sp.]